MSAGEIISRGRRGKEAPRQQEQQEDLSLAGTHTDSRGPLWEDAGSSSDGAAEQHGIWLTRMQVQDTAVDLDRRRGTASALATERDIPPAFAHMWHTWRGRVGTCRGCNKDGFCHIQTGISAICRSFYAGWAWIRGRKRGLLTGWLRRGHGGYEPVTLQEARPNNSLKVSIFWSFFRGLWVKVCKETGIKTKGLHLSLACTEHTSPLARSPVNLVTLFTVTARCRIYCRTSIPEKPKLPTYT